MKNSVARPEWRRSPAVPLALLLLALATVFLFGGDRGYFYKPFGDDHITGNHLTVAENLAPEHHFLGFYRQVLNADGNPSYEPYNRFPPLGHVLIRLVTLPFPDDISARVLAARMLMLAFFTGAATLAYLALGRLVGNRWTALAATPLAFSSYYSLYYNDLVATEGVVDLFGVLLVFHGTVVAAWRRRDGPAARRHVRLGVVAVVFGAGVLSVNVTREYVALGGEVSLAGLSSVGSWLFRTRSGEHSDRKKRLSWDRPELSSLGSMLYRTGRFDLERTFRELPWRRRAEHELRAVGRASVPYAVSSFVRNDAPGVIAYRVFGIVVILSTLVLIFSSTICSRLPLAALVASRPCWLLAVLYVNTFVVEFELVFYVGVPLLVFTLILAHLDRLCRGRGQVAVFAGVASVPVFVLSSLLMAQEQHDPERRAFERTLTADVEAIRERVEGKIIFILPRVESRVIKFQQIRNFYFTGSIFTSSVNEHLAEFVVAERFADVRSLTPDNELVFLYDRVSYDAALAATLSWYKQRIGHDTLIAQSSDYVVYFVKGERNERNTLLFLRDDCPAAVFRKPRSRFFLHVVPVDTVDLPAWRQQYGFDNLDFGFKSYKRVGGVCYAVRRLPAYRIVEIRIGEFVTHAGPTYETIWEGSFSPIEMMDGIHRSS